MIKLVEPIKIGMDLIEVDDVIPSFKMMIDIEFIYPFETYLYKRRNVWFQCSVWDEFILNMNYIEDGKDAALKDMNEYFIITIKKQKNNLQLQVSCVKPQFMDSLSSTRLEYRTEIDRDLFLKMKAAFNDFPKWW